MKCIHVYYSGHVQGVGFRYTAVDCARKHPVTGYVKNLPDGRVEILAEGKEDDLNNFLKDIRKVMEPRIQDERFSWEPASGRYSRFTTAW